MSRIYSVDLQTIVREHELSPVRAARDFSTYQVCSRDVNRPGLQFAGFYDYFDPNRIQIMGKVETTFLLGLTPEARKASIDRFMASGIRVLIAAHCDEVVILPEIREGAERFEVNLLSTEQLTNDLLGQLIVNLNIWLAPRTTVHGVLMEIHGEGVLITGESGMGKSENAMALLQRGHRLVADDAVEIRRTTRHTLLGSAPEVIRNFMEIRGIGLVDARHLFGIGAVKPDQVVDLVVEFELWNPEKTYDRLGLETQYIEILDVKIPYNVIPVRPGRNLAAILELAAMNNREKNMGYNAARALVERHDQLVDLG